MSDECREILAEIEGLRASLAEFKAHGTTALGGPEEVPETAGEAVARLTEHLDEIVGKVRAEVERQAQGHDELFREMVELLPEAVFRVDADLRLVYTNPAAIEMLGTEPEALEQQPSLLDYIEEVDHSLVRRLVGELGLGRKPRPALIKAKRPDGRPLIVEAVAAPIIGSDGSVTGLWGVGRDVTERELAAELAEIMNRLRVSLAATSDLQEALVQVLNAALVLDGVDAGQVFSADAKTGELRLVAGRGLSAEFVNAVAARGSDPNHGGRIEELTNDGLIHLGHADIVGRRDSVTAHEAREGLRAVVMLPIMQGGRAVAVLAASSHLVDQIPERTLAALGEFSMQLRGPIARIRAEQARREVVDTLQGLIDVAPLAIYSFDLDGNVTMWNAAAERTFGWSESEVLGHKPQFVPTDYLEEFQANLDATLGEGPLEPLELQRARKDGTPVFIRVSRARLHDHRGKLVGHVAMAEDVTEAKRSEEDKLRLTRLESLGVMAGGIAHDFNNLLMGVLGNVSLARQESDPAKLDELLSGVQGASEKAVGLTRQLLTFAKGGAPTKELAVLNDLVADVSGFTLSGSNVRADYRLEETWPAEVDLGQIAQVVQNLVINAKEAIRGEGGVIAISTADRTEPNGDQYVEIAVSDTGSGVPPRIREQIFDPYFSTKKAGSGLGLSVAHSIVTRHGGKFELESTVRAGSTFRVLLPAKPGVIAQPEPSALPRGGGKASVRVLVVDDEDMVRKILSRMLGLLGHETVLAVSGDEAVRMVQAAQEAGEHFPLAIMDLTMPGSLGGVEATAALIKMDPDMKVIVSSGYSDDRAIADYAKYGFSAAIQKPYTLDILRETLERVL